MMITFYTVFKYIYIYSVENLYRVKLDQVNNNRFNVSRELA